MISHWAGKTNPADALSRRPDYKDVKQVSKTMETLLPTLQQKLATLASVFSPRFAPIVGQLLAGVGRTIRPKDPEPRIEPLVGAGETPAPQMRNIAEKQLNLVAGTVGCKQLVPRMMVRDLAAYETVIDSPSQVLVDMIYTIQSTDAFVLGKQKAADVQAKRKAKTGKPSPWRFDSKSLLFHGEQVYVLEEEFIRAELLKRHHDNVLAGHFEVERTLELVGRKYYWTGMSQDVKDYVASCDVCQRVKVPRHRPYGSLTSLPKPEGPWQQIAIDFITGLPLSKRKGIIYNAILVVIDRYTKMARYIPTTKTVTAVELADLFFEEIICRFGVPKGCVTDRGSVFTSAYWSDLCYYLQIKQRLSTAFHPQTDGQTKQQCHERHRVKLYGCGLMRINCLRKKGIYLQQTCLYICVPFA